MSALAQQEMYFGRSFDMDEILDGIESYPGALQFMFNGGNLGKLMVKP